MAMRAGTKLGPYEILAPIGAGGMGEVYRARDSRLGREVAVKILPERLAADEDRLRRLQLEAQAASSLNHPNILVIYDIGTQDGTPYVVSELLQGETLRERLNSGPLPARKAVELAIQAARGLAAAHQKGIIHRDLKPENIFITNEGHLRILDFGLAKVKSAVTDDVATALSGNRVNTDPGMVLGTVGYMAPEQVRGAVADNRSDIFSLGTVLYEMVTGARAFRGESDVETLNAILKEEPASVSQTVPAIPLGMERIIEHCIEKSPAARFQSAHDLAFALEALSGSGLKSGSDLALQRGRYFKTTKGLVVATTCILAAVSALFLMAWNVRGSNEAAMVVRFGIPLPDKSSLYDNVETHNLSISPDGTKLAYVVRTEGQLRIWLRQLGNAEAKPIPGTEGGFSPFWSPDSKNIAFFAGGKLKRIESSGTSAQTICDLAAETETSGTWGNAGQILFLDRVKNRDKIFKISAAGGTPSELNLGFAHTPSEAQLGWLYFLPDGKHFLFYGVPIPDGIDGAIYSANIDRPESKLLLSTQPTRVEWAAGHLLYAKEGTVLAQPFDEKSQTLSGEPQVIIENFPYFDKTGWAEFSASNNGVLAYATEQPLNRLVWFDRTGREMRQVGQPDRYSQVRLSPHGDKLLLNLTDAHTSSGDLWIHDLNRDSSTRFVSGPTDDSEPMWSPNGRQVAYFSCCAGRSTLYIKNFEDSEKSTTPLDAGFQVPQDWSSDGKFMLFSTQESRSPSQLWVLPVQGTNKPYRFAAGPYNQQDARFSPDGRWVAYVSNETGTGEVYVTSFDHPGEKYRISHNGGISVHWRRDGKELLFLAADSTVMSVNLKPGKTFVSGQPVALFRNAAIMKDGDGFDLRADGQQIIAITRATQVQSMPIEVTVNWTAALKH